MRLGFVHQTGDRPPVVATALLDRLLHHAVVVQIEGSSYRLRQHAALMPEHLRSKAAIPRPCQANLRDPAAVLRKMATSPRQPDRPIWGILLRHFWGKFSRH